MSTAAIGLYTDTNISLDDEAALILIELHIAARAAAEQRGIALSDSELNSVVRRAARLLGRVLSEEV